MGSRLKPRQDPPGSPAGHAAGGLPGVGSGLGGSEVLAPTTSLNQFSLAADPSQPAGNQNINPLPTPTPTITLIDSPDTPLSSTNPTPVHQGSSKSNKSTVIIAAVAGVALLLIGLGALLLFCRSGNRSGKKRQSRRGGQWREIDSRHSHQHSQHSMADYTGRPNHYDHDPALMYGTPRAPSEGMFESKSLYSTRRSTDAPPSLHLSFVPEPLMSSNPFAASPVAPVPPLPSMPAVQHVQQPVQPQLEHQQEPPSAGFTAPPTEYSASYYRSIYSSAHSDGYSIADSQGTLATNATPRSRSNTLKKAPSRLKNEKELIALDNLISALDFNDNDKSGVQLPDPALFRAALSNGGGAAASRDSYHYA